MDLCEAGYVEGRHALFVLNTSYMWFSTSDHRTWNIELCFCCTGDRMAMRRPETTITVTAARFCTTFLFHARDTDIARAQPPSRTIFVF